MSTRKPEEKPPAPVSERAGCMRPIGEIVGEIARKVEEKMRSRDAS